MQGTLQALGAFALRQTAPRAQVVAVIDADYVVRPSWLRDLVPAFAAERTGVVQAPQDYRDAGESAFKAMCHAEYRGFFHIGMVTRNERNANMSRPFSLLAALPHLACHRLELRPGLGAALPHERKVLGIFPFDDSLVKARASPTPSIPVCEPMPLADWPRELPGALEPLTTKPLIAVENGPNGIDCALEMELAELPPEEAAEFRTGPSALDEVVLRLKEALGLITFFTVGDTEARSWTLQHGETALDAAESIHSDIARGFIRCEVIRWDDLLECGSHSEAAKRGLQRLEGKTYVVEDGDVLNIRFNV